MQPSSPAPQVAVACYVPNHPHLCNAHVLALFFQYFVCKYMQESKAASSALAFDAAADAAAAAAGRVLISESVATTMCAFSDYLWLRAEVAGRNLFNVDAAHT